MAKKLPAVAAALLLVGLLLAPANTGEFVRSSVTAGWHALATAVSALSNQ
jgi:hypothetical protein